MITISLFTTSRLRLLLCSCILVGAGCAQGDTATLEANKAVVRRWAELEDQGNVDGLPDLVTPDCVFHYPGGVDIRGVDALVENAAQSIAALTSQHRRIDLEVAEGDLVATRYTFTATHTGDYAGNPPTGNEITLTFMSLCRVAEGRMSECWIEFDSRVFMQQLGGAGESSGA